MASAVRTSAVASASGAMARRAYSTNRCLTAMWSASSNSHASFSASWGMWFSLGCHEWCVWRSEQRRVHLAAEMAVFGHAFDKGLDGGGAFTGLRCDEARAALRQAL